MWGRALFIWAFLFQTSFCGCPRSSIFFRDICVLCPYECNQEEKGLIDEDLKIAFIVLRTISVGNPSYSSWNCNSFCSDVIAMKVKQPMKSVSSAWYHILEVPRRCRVVEMCFFWEQGIEREKINKSNQPIVSLTVSLARAL